jgi:hypothetical protein
LNTTPLGRQNYCVRTWREIKIRTFRDFLSIRTQDTDLASVVFVKKIFESVHFFLNNPVQLCFSYTVSLEYLDEASHTRCNCNGTSVWMLCFQSADTQQHSPLSSEASVLQTMRRMWRQEASHRRAGSGLLCTSTSKVVAELKV